MSFFKEKAVKILLQLILSRDFYKKHDEALPGAPYNSYEGKINQKGFQGIFKGANPFVCTEQNLQYWKCTVLV